ncbi:GNAT family N-acetyltransferase [Halomicronema sp. CCY15110]|uniref:GNAT family N-acetyltransferase n=1 Tax=Halomicronema sp. CCY15110 TaxID=2767773 RepID=UPI0019506625|nr:N-acetyltransferase [Halomicronema sp. CCY15110]
MSVVTIRPANEQDAADLADLAERTFRDTFATENNPADMALHCAEHFGVAIQRQEILAPNHVILLAEVDTQLAAFAQVRLHAPKAGIAAPQPAELQRLYVEKAWHGRGVAHKLMLQVLATAMQTGTETIWLGVWEHNPRAIAFYRKYGFQVVGEHVFQFGNDPQRDLVMAATLND